MNALRVENPYYNPDKNMSTDRAEMIQTGLQKKKKPLKGFQQPKGLGKGISTPRPISDGNLEMMLSPTGLHNLGNAQQYAKIVQMKHHKMLQDREDQSLREYARLTQGLPPSRRETILGASRRGYNPGDLSDIGAGTEREQEIARAVGQASKRSRSTIELASAELSGRPFVPSKGRWGYEAGGGALHGATTSGTQFITVNPERRRQRAAAAAAG